MMLIGYEKNWYSAILVVLFIWLMGCSPTPMGTYVAKHHENTIDTIVILANGTYKQSIYRKADSKRLFLNDGKWLYKDGRIRFSNFFQNDDISRRENYDFNSVLVTFSTPLERNFLGRPVFDYDEETATYRYTKIFW